MVSARKKNRKRPMMPVVQELAAVFEPGDQDQVHAPVTRVIAPQTLQIEHTARSDKLNHLANLRNAAHTVLRYQNLV